MARELECHVIVPEYPGYGISGGYATEDTVDAVVHAAIRLATETLGTPAHCLILYGRSVGTGPAAAAGARTHSYTDSSAQFPLQCSSPFSLLIPCVYRCTYYETHLCAST